MKNAVPSAVVKPFGVDDLDRFAPQSRRAFGLHGAEAVADLMTHAYADVCAVYVCTSDAAPTIFRCDRVEADDLAVIAYDDAYLARANGLGVRTLRSLPFTTEGAPGDGVVVFGFAGEVSVPDVVLERAAASIAKSIEQAQLLEHHWNVSNRLQRALMPAELPGVDGLAIEPAYRPATSESVVGGDWYDVFEIEPGLYGVSIGDVTGHGIEAAVAMSEIRRAIRAAASRRRNASELLNDVDAQMAAQNIGMASGIAGFYDAKTAVLRYACAGHPHPVLLNGTGRAMFLPGGGLLLGLGMEPASQEWTVTLGPASCCYFYTDGLLEYGRDVIEGERRLIATVEQLGREGRSSAEMLHDRVFARTPNSDDTATLMLQRAATLPNESSYTFSAVPQSAVLAREALRYVFARKDVPEERAHEILSATGEAVANAVEHSGSRAGVFTMRIALHERDVEISVRSDGHWRPFVPRDERGRGIPLMRAFSTRLNVATVADATTVTLYFGGVF